MYLLTNTDKHTVYSTAWQRKLDSYWKEWTKSSASEEAYPAIWPLLTPKTRPSLELSPQNERKPVQDQAKPPRKISCRLVKPGWEWKTKKAQQT